MTDVHVEVKEQLYQALTQQIKILRNLLTSLQDENHAIVSGDLHMLDEVMEERLIILSSFESHSRTLFHALRVLNSDSVLDIPEDPDLGHRDAIELLEQLLDVEDFEVTSLRDQVVSLLDEVEKQNNLNALRIKENSHRLVYEPRPDTTHHNMLHVTDGAYLPKPARVQLMVMELGETEENP